MKRISNKFLVAVLALSLVAAPVVAPAALSTAIRPTSGGIAITRTDAIQVPVSIFNDWQTLVTAIDTADNSGSTVVNPGGITRSAQRKFDIGGIGTTVQFRIRYTTGTTITAGTIQPFGFDANGAPDKLYGGAVGATTLLNTMAFTSDASNDVQDGTYSYTESQECDANGATSVMAAIKVAATGTGAATAVVQCRVK